MVKLVVFLTVFLTSLPSHAVVLRHHIYPLCQALFGTNVGHARALFSGYVRVRSGNELYLRVDTPGWARPKRWVLLVPGLLASHRNYDQMGQQLLASGIGVVRLDLRGFSRSLLREWQRAQEKGIELKAPTEIHFSEYVADIFDILSFLNRRFHVRRPEMVGHSMGGGLTLAVLADPRSHKIISPRATLIAPYIYRLEYRAAERMTIGNLPVPNPFFALERVTPTILRNETERFFDMMAEPQLRAAFGVYFDDFVKAGFVDFGDEQPSTLRTLQIDYGIAAVKGLRELNSLVLFEQIPQDVHTNLIIGKWDPIVDRGLAMKLGSMVHLRGGRVVELKAGHMVHNQFPDEVVPHILESHP